MGALGGDLNLGAAGDVAGLDGGTADLLPPADVRAAEGVRPKTFGVEAHRSGSGV